MVIVNNPCNMLRDILNHKQTLDLYSQKIIAKIRAYIYIEFLGHILLGNYFEIGISFKLSLIEFLVFGPAYVICYSFQPKILNKQPIISFF